MITVPDTTVTVVIPAWLRAERKLVSSEWTGPVTWTSAKAYRLQGTPVVRLAEACLRCGNRRGDGLAHVLGYCRGCADTLGLPHFAGAQLDLDELLAAGEVAMRMHRQALMLPRPPHTRLVAGQIPDLPSSPAGG